MSKTSEPQSLYNYMAQIERELRDLPSQARAEEMREIEAHLRTMIEARGDVAAVLTQFGAPRKVGRDLRRAWERKQPEIWWRAIAAAMLAMSFYLFIALPLMQGFYNFYLGLHGIDINSYQPANADLQMLAVFQRVSIYAHFISVFMIFITTYLMGLISPKRGKWMSAALLLFAFSPVVINPIHTAPSLVFALMLSLAVAFPIGSWLGARHSRRLLSRIANTN